MLLTQEYIILFLLNQFTIASIKTAFTLLIGGNGSEADFFYIPLPTQKPKLIDSFPVLIYNTKSMMVDNKKQKYK
jgi:hypothetical protein